MPFFTGFTLRSALLLCYVGIFCAAIGFLLTAKITEYTSATEASFVYLIKPVLATLLAVVCFRETISVNRMIGLVFFLAASLCVSVPVLLRDAAGCRYGAAAAVSPFTGQKSSGRFHGRSFFIRSQKSMVPSRTLRS